jgi:hypothetical protein
VNDRLALAFGPHTVAELERLAPIFGERTPEGMVARAIGLMTILTKYMHDGYLTVVPLHQLEQLDPEIGVDLHFQARESTDQRAA